MLRRRTIRRCSGKASLHFFDSAWGYEDEHFICFSIAPIACVAWPSATLGAKLKEIVTAGNRP